MTDREKLILLLRDALEEWQLNLDFGRGDFADHIIANGVVVREKGEWELLHGGFKWRCTACGSKVSLDGSPEENGLYFCPNCGADMRKGENG